MKETDNSTEWLPQTCWSCNKNVVNDRNVLYNVPSISGYFTRSKINDQMKYVPTKAIIAFCSDCDYTNIYKKILNNKKCKCCKIFIPNDHLTNNRCKYCIDELKRNNLIDDQIKDNKSEIVNVKCDICEKRFSSCFNDSKSQGNRCSSYMSNFTITCRYGSRYDFNLYNWNNIVRPIEHQKANNICDDCIEKFISNNYISLIKYYP